MAKGDVTDKKKDDDSSAINEKMLENLIELQKVHTNLAERFDKLSDQISKLLALFEGAARDFAKEPANVEKTEKDKEFLEKINSLLEQNKAIARGIIMLEDKISSPENAPQPAQRMPMPQQQPVYQHAEQQAPPTFRPAPTGRPLPKF